jgi:hypothetical protein
MHCTWTFIIVCRVVATMALLRVSATRWIMAAIEIKKGLGLKPFLKGY